MPTLIAPAADRCTSGSRNSPTTPVTTKATPTWRNVSAIRSFRHRHTCVSSRIIAPPRRRETTRSPKGLPPPGLPAPQRSPTAAIRLVPDSVKSPADLLCCGAQARQQLFPDILRSRSTLVAVQPIEPPLYRTCRYERPGNQGTTRPSQDCVPVSPGPPLPATRGAFREGRVSPVDEGRRPRR